VACGIASRQYQRSSAALLNYAVTGAFTDTSDLRDLSHDLQIHAELITCSSNQVDCLLFPNPAFPNPAFPNPILPNPILS
jgi:hypothetical protein